MSFNFIKNKDGFRLVDEITGKQFGEIFQENARSIEWQSALIVYEKYKRKFNLKYQNLLDLRYYMVNFSNERINQGKKVNKDILVQEASKIIKENKNSIPSVNNI